MDFPLDALFGLQWRCGTSPQEVGQCVLASIVLTFFFFFYAFIVNLFHNPWIHQTTFDADVSSVEISLEEQEVIVKGTAPFELVEEKIKGTRKEVREN